MEKKDITERGRVVLSDNSYVNQNYTPDDPEKNAERFSTALFGYAKEEVEKYIGDIETHSSTVEDRFYTEDIVALQKANRDLVQKLSKLEQDLDEANYHIQTTTNRTDTFTKNEDELKKRIGSLQSKMTVLQDTLMRETDAKKQAYTKLSDAFEQIEKLKDTNSNLNRRVEEAQVDIERFTSELELAREETIRLQVEYTRNESDLEDTNSRLSLTKNTLMHTESLLERTQAEFAEEQAEHSMAKTELITSKTDLANVKMQLSNTSTQMAGLQSELTAALADLSTERAKATNTAIELSNMKVDFASNKSELTRITKELSTTREMLDSARAEIESIHIELSTRNNEIADLTLSAQNLKNMLAESDITIETMRIEVNAKDDHIETLLQQVDDMGYDIMRLNETLKDQKDELIINTGKIAELESHSAETSSELEQRTTTLEERDSEVSELRNRIEVLEQNIRNLDRRREIAEESMKEAQERVSAANRTLREYSAREVQSVANVAKRQQYPMPQPQQTPYNPTPQKQAGAIHRFDQRTAGRSGYQSMQIPLSQINAQLAEIQEQNIQPIGEPQIKPQERPAYMPQQLMQQQIPQPPVSQQQMPQRQMPQQGYTPLYPRPQQQTAPAPSYANRYDARAVDSSMNSRNPLAQPRMAGGEQMGMPDNMIKHPEPSAPLPQAPQQPQYPQMPAYTPIYPRPQQQPQPQMQQQFRTQPQPQPSQADAFTMQYDSIKNAVDKEKSIMFSPQTESDRMPNDNLIETQYLSAFDINKEQKDPMFNNDFGF